MYYCYNNIQSIPINCILLSGRFFVRTKPRIKTLGGIHMGHRHYSITNADSQALNVKLLSISLSNDDADWASVLHSHQFTELFYIIEGEGKFVFRDETFSSVQRGDLIIIPPYTEHTEQSLPEKPLKYYVLAIDGISFQLRYKQYFTQIFCNFRSNHFIKILFEQMHYEVRSHDYGSDTICQNLLEILTLKIMRSEKVCPVPVTATKMTKECAKIKEYLDANYAKHITLDTLTDLTHMNKYYISHSFAKYTGLSPIQYLNELRLEAACRLLEKTDFSISDIASATGFSSQSYFTQAFHKKHGMTPIKYRQESGKHSAAQP